MTLLAAIWADGSTFGDSKWVNRLLERRFILQKHVDNAISILQRALNVNTDTKSLIAELQTNLDSLNYENPDDQSLARSCYTVAIQQFTKPQTCLDGRPVPDRQVLQFAITELEERRERLRQYR